MSMKEKLREFFCGKSVVILGFGREGRSTLSLIRNYGCKSITVADKNEIPQGEAPDCILCCGENYLSCLGDCDIIMKAPGIGLKDSVTDEIKAKITSQTDLFLRFCESRIIGITGTKGKSTVSSLIFHFVSSCGRTAMLIGNIGVPPLSRLDDFTKDSIIVCEMSCHQLEYVKASPDIAVLLNVYPEHLDHYASFEAYRNAKLNIFAYQKPGDTLIIFDEIKRLAQNAKAKVITAGFDCGDTGTKNGGIFTSGGFYPKGEFSTRLKGEHNLYNIAIALTAAAAAGCDEKRCLEALSDFSGLEHRLEYVCTINGAEYINDSISTAVQTTIAALKAYPDTDTLIIGGLDRGIPYDGLSEYINGSASLRTLIYLPDSGKRIAENVTNPAIEKVYAENMEQAVKAAIPRTKIRCILSPASASYGFYKNFEERGRHYKELLGANSK